MANLNEQSIFTNQKENRAGSSNEEWGNGVFRLYDAVHTYEEYTSDDFLSNMSSADVQFYDVGYKKKGERKEEIENEPRRVASYWLKGRTDTYPRAEHFNDFLHTSSGSGRLGILR